MPAIRKAKTKVKPRAKSRKRAKATAAGVLDTSVTAAAVSPENPFDPAYSTTPLLQAIARYAREVAHSRPRSRVQQSLVRVIIFGPDKPASGHGSHGRPALAQPDPRDDY
jgi:hypothetical protein